jgi:hypothetical protein
MQNVNPMTNHVNSLIGWNNYLRENFYTLGIKKKGDIIIIIIIIEWDSKKKNNVWFYTWKHWLSV